MVIITFASRKGGSGKSTLAAHLSAYANKASRRCLLVDADPQGSLTLWHSLRKGNELLLRNGVRGIDNVVKAAKDAELEWVFIDTPPQISGVVNDAIRAATLVVIPARPSVFDLDAVKETIAYCRERRKPYAIVVNGAPAVRDGNEAPIATSARKSLDDLKAPVWAARLPIARPTRWRLLKAKAPASTIRARRPRARSAVCSPRSNAASSDSGRRRERKGHAPPRGVVSLSGFGEGESRQFLLQLRFDFVDAGLGAGLVLFAARRTGHADRPDGLLAHLDRQARRAR